MRNYDSTERYPRSVQIFKSDKQKSNLHSTQKPLALCEYLIKTYTNENELVLSKRKTWDAIYSVDQKNVFLGLRNNYENYTLASYCAQIIEKITLPDQPDINLYKIFLQVLTRLDHRQNPSNVREYFHVNTLKNEGLIPLEQDKVSELEFNKILAEYTGSRMRGYSH